MYILSRPRVGPFPCCCGLADGGVADRPQELETSFVSGALVAGERCVQWPPGPGVPPFPPPPSRPQATVITEPHVRWPATIYASQSPGGRGFISPDLAKRFDLCILILRSYEGQKPISYKNLLVGTVCQKLLKTTSTNTCFCMINSDRKFLKSRPSRAT